MLQLNYAFFASKSMNYWRFFSFFRRKDAFWEVYEATEEEIKAANEAGKVEEVPNSIAEVEEEEHGEEENAGKDQGVVSEDGGDQNDSQKQVEEEQ